VEDALLRVLTNEIESFESRTYRSSESTAAELIRFLLEQNGQSPKELWDVLGGKSHASEILSGKRPIGAKLAVRLGNYFSISPAAFMRLR
jgi:antitoxin component HigA of HigAB toxin-antitoxin module